MSSHQYGHNNRKVGEVTRVWLPNEFIINDDSHFFLEKREAEINEW